MLYVLLIAVGVLALVVYVYFIMLEVPGAAEERLGVPERPQVDLGVWMTDDSSDEAVSAGVRGLRRERRWLRGEVPGIFGGGTLVEQVRYRDASTGEIVRVEPERVRRLKRQRT